MTKTSLDFLKHETNSMKAIAEEALEILDSNIAGMMEKNYIGKEWKVAENTWKLVEKKWEELNTEVTLL